MQAIRLSLGGAALPGHIPKGMAVLLQIRQTAARRNSIILGTVWAVGMLAVFLSNFYGAPNTQSIFLTNVILIAIGLGFVFNLLRFEIFSHLSDLVDFLQRES